MDYTPPLDHLVLALKFGGRLELTRLLARVLHESTMHPLEQPLPALLTAVPLGPLRLAERGFNQALEIAKPLSRKLRIPLCPRLLIRQRETLPQSLLHPDERHKNIGGAFALSPSFLERVRAKHVGVVDDVMTTGETLNEVASVLKRFGAARVTNVVFARTPP